MNEGQRQKTVVVLGAARSGTSVTAGILEALGVDMGTVGSSRKWNPKGSFEDKDFQKLNRDIFRMVEQSKSYWDPPTQRQIMEQQSLAASRIQSLVAEKSSGKSLWGWKNPRAVLTMELYLPYLINPHFVTVLRDPLATAKSSVKHTRGRIDLQQAIRLVDFYGKEIRAFFERHPELPNISLSFEDLVADPKKEAARLAEFLGLELTEDKLANVYKFVIPREEIEAAKEKAIGAFTRRLPRFIRKRLGKLRNDRS